MMQLDNEREYYLQLIYKRCRKRMSYVNKRDIDADFKKKYPSGNLCDVQISLHKDMDMIEWPKFMCDNRMRLTAIGMEYCLENFSVTHMLKNFFVTIANFARGR
jgi:hypothetical protein